MDGCEEGLGEDKNRVYQTELDHSQVQGPELIHVPMSMCVCERESAALPAVVGVCDGQPLSAAASCFGIYIYAPKPLQASLVAAARR